MPDPRGLPAWVGFVSLPRRRALPTGVLTTDYPIGNARRGVRFTVAEGGFEEEVGGSRHLEVEVTALELSFRVVADSVTYGLSPRDPLARRAAAELGRQADVVKLQREALQSSAITEPSTQLGPACTPLTDESLLALGVGAAEHLAGRTRLRIVRPAP